MSIVVTDLTKIYGTQKAIDNVSFRADKGEILGLLGPNGAGKTTTMKILTCYMPSSLGKAEVCGLEVGRDDMEIKTKVGYLPEHNPLYGTMYVKEYLTFVAKIHKIKNRKQRIAELLSQVGLEREQNKIISSLSKGYRQRIGLAQALIHDPEVLILDEPMSGLDPNQIIEIRNLISSLKKDKTIIFSSHILQEVESISDKILILDQGKVVASDSLVGLNERAQQKLSVLLEVIGELDMGSIKGIAGVEGIASMGGGAYKLEVASEELNALAIREKIFDAIVGNGCKLIGLQIDKQSLENVFKSVTKEKK